MNPTAKSAPPAPKPRRILVVDDHPMMREGLRQLIAHEPDLTLCCEAEDAAHALQLIEQSRPDLALVDISLKNGNGLELIKDIRARLPDLPVLVLSMHDESLYAERVLRAGGQGYLMKHEGGERIIAAIRQVLSGKIFLSDSMSNRLLGQLAGRRSGPGAGPSVERLTDREFEVFQLIGQGRTTRDIASHLRVSVKTVEAHRVNIKQKLGVQTAPELIRFAVRWVETRATV